jgi:hypothetical protein
MKSYDQTLNEIYTKANNQISEMHQRKQKRIKIVAAFAPLCLLLVVSLSIGVGMSMNKTPTNDPISDQESHLGNNTDAGIILENPTVDDSTTADDFVSGGISSAEPSIYPSAWKKMNAVIVKWGEQNDQTWVENYGRYSHYNEENYSIEYVGVNVEFVTIFSETMSESNITDIEKIIENTTYLMIPKFYLDEIETGDTSLVFLQQIARFSNTAPDGKFLGTYTTVLGATVGQCLAEDKYVPASIFNIKDDKIRVPEQAYEINPENEEYYSPIMNALQEANEYVLKNDSSFSVAFRDGASVEDISELFAIVCNGKSR